MPIIRAYRLWIRGRNKVFSLAAGRSFKSFGSRSVIHLPVKINGEHGISVGEEVMIGPGCWIECHQGGSLHIADGAKLVGRATITCATEVTLERDCLLAGGVYVSDHSHKRDDESRAIREQGITPSKPVVIGAGSWIGQNAVILPGVTIGHNAVVGANSVVGCDVPDGAVAVGAPARVLPNSAASLLDRSRTTQPASS